MNSIQKKIVAGIGIYEVVLITFVLVFEPYLKFENWSNQSSKWQAKHYQRDDT